MVLFRFLRILIMTSRDCLLRDCSYWVVIALELSVLTKLPLAMLDKLSIILTQISFYPISQS